MSILKIDIDYKPPELWWGEWIGSREWILQGMGIKVRKLDWFETKRGYHVYITLDKELTDNDINKLQFLLGDDHTRVKINQWRIERGIERWNKLYHKVLYRKQPKTVTCFYCGNRIPIIIRNNKGVEAEK